MNRAGDKLGFSLVEMMTTIAIMALLLGLLAPALTSSQAASKKVRCIANLKQVATACEAYCSDNGSRYPPNFDDQHLVIPYTNWVAGNMLKDSERGALELIENPRRSLLAKYFSARAVLRCSVDKSKNARSLALNCRINPVGDTGRPAWSIDDRISPSVFMTSAELRSPSTTFTFLEERDTSINDGLFAVDATNTGMPYGDATSRPFVMVDFPSIAHNRGSIVAFADAHVEHHKWLEKTTFSGPPKRRFTSSADADARWLQDRLIGR